MKTRILTKKLLSLLLLATMPLVAQDKNPTPVPELLYAVPFELQESYTNYWRAERPKVTSGYLVVLEVVPFPTRQVAEPVLYVGDQTAERLNSAEFGRVIAIVPGNVSDPSMSDYIDLATAPIWFGTPDLPERVDAKIIEGERDRADAAGIAPFSEDAVNFALAQGGAKLEVQRKTDLLSVIADLLESYSPRERELIDMYRLERN